jgi:protein-tyrosine phosphatase
MPITLLFYYSTVMSLALTNISPIKGKFLEYDFSNETGTIDHIIENIYLGSCASCLDVVNNRPDIKYILNLSQYKLYAPYKIVLELNIDDEPNFPINNYFDETHQFINDAKNNNSNILIHCRSGHSRSPTIVISYIMKFHGLTFDDAYQLVNNKRKIFPNY